MKLNIIDDNNIIVFFNTLKMKELDFSNKDNIESSFKNFFLKLKHLYNINIEGYYNIDIYIDKNYGSILKMEHEDIEYFDYFESKIDMRINIVSDTTFLYKVKDIFYLKKELTNNTFYLFKGHIYLLLKKDISFYNLGYLLEISDIVYDNIVNDIIKLGKIINIKDILCYN